MVNDNLSKESFIRDLNLVEKAVKGDQKAYAELMMQYEDSLYNMMLKKVNDPVVAEDLTIEAFTKAFQNLAKFSPDFAFSTWLYKIAINNCIDYLRKKKNDPCARDKNNHIPQPEAIDLAIDPEENFIRDQRQRLLREVVDKLNPRYNQLIKLRYFEELSYEEIAARLELPLGTVKAGIFRAKELLYLILVKSKDI
ncbi:MAG: sigma-70 family RNA polymerase sigma factor [Lentimicrobiaceae bacterium]|nr:sigma-70 family RNA polymerase sigma factor [Lentimicrobiaceae bacterium]MCO5265912.1 sigma-70 family RNA polymerase sigma factor [Lentimicrobium sp.]HPG33416.1 sigma-70 family RNA polymerase sigma factor [Lentimicrobium sp.]